ncbi:MAG TPA: sensor domain-containing diguanylate cyclase [Candidatus Limnocylindrales bacterium]|nr:sensor domain-containing diguanylate cyclase [Candidatus Limnocylindrales bacterium]
MAMPLPNGVATQLAGQPGRERSRGHARVAAVRIIRTFWPRDRGVAELRWAALTLAIMALLGTGSMWLDPATGDFDRIVALAIPAAIVFGIVAWSGRAADLGRSRMVRLLIGPTVLGIAILGGGGADISTLQLPPTAPLVLLAMAYAAMTPGYPIAAAIVVGASVGVLVSHAQVVAVTGQASIQTDEFTVGCIVIILASAGMAVIVRVAADAEARATRLAIRSGERADILERVSAIVARFDGSQPIRAVIQAVVDDIAREFEITLVSMYLPFGSDQLTMVGVAGYPAPFHEIEIGVGIIGRAAATQQTQFVPDVSLDPDYRAARDDVRSEVAVPVVHSGELLGVVNLEGTLARPIGPTQVALAEMVVQQVSAALRSARLDDERRDRLHAIERVLAVSRALVADLDRPRIVASIVDAVAELLAADLVALFSRNEDGVFRLEAGVGFPPRAMGLEVHGSRGMVGRAIVERTRIDGLQEVAAWPVEFLDDRAGGTTAHAAMALPIVVSDEVVAVLFVTRVGPERAYSELERGIADLLTAQVAIALQNADLHARVAESALRDPLTGLLNRRFFDEAVETAMANARRAVTPLSLIVLDLDRFSAVNNEYGHTVGDAVLHRVGRAIKSSVRDGDVVVRYGGEEFVVIAPGTDGDGAVVAAERIREAVAASSLDPVDGRLVPLTISAGVACLVDETDGRGLFRAADSALLAAKRAGRDRVTRI